MLTRRDRGAADVPTGEGVVSRRVTLRLGLVAAAAGVAVAAPGAAHAQAAARPGPDAPQCLEDLWER